MNDLYAHPSIADGIAAIRRRWPQLSSASEERPVFVLSAGWRSGSTLLQRLVTDRRFMWGEPYGHAWIFDSMAQTLRSFTSEWPEDKFIYQGQSEQQRAESFVANLYPDPERLLQAYLSFFEQLFVKPANEAGIKDWGIKEVRLTADHAAFLRWLYPQSKLLFLYRNPYDAYKSYAARRNAGWKWFNRWPDHPLTVTEFARHWRTLVTGFIEKAAELNAFTIRYEDLASKRYGELEDYLGFSLSANAAQVRPADGPEPISEIESSELGDLDHELRELAEKLGYSYRKPKPIAAPVARSLRAAANSRCVILVPVGGHIEPACESSLQKLENRGYRVRRVRGYSAIDQGRNQLASDALADGFEETMWIDSDIDFDPDAVEQLRSHQLPISSAIYPKKGKRELACHVLPGTEQLVFGKNGGLVEILYAGTGFLHVRREAYVQIQQTLQLPSCNDRWGRPSIPFFHPMVKPHLDGYWYLAEDFSFSDRARQAGFEIMADTTIRLKHIGSYGYSWEDAGSEPSRYATFTFKLTDSDDSFAKRLDSHTKGAGAEIADPKICALADEHRWPKKKPNVPGNKQHGWLNPSTRELLAQFLNDETRLVVELGAWLGLSTRFIADHAPKSAVVAIDHWMGNPPQRERVDMQETLRTLYETFLVSCWEYRKRVVPLRMNTVDGMRELARFELKPDLIYIDADHAYDAVRQDIETAFELFSDAIIVGDDWDREGVQRAASEFSRRHDIPIRTHGNAWCLNR